MAITADEVAVLLTARVAKYEADVKRARQTFDSQVGAIERRGDKMTRELQRNFDHAGDGRKFSSNLSQASAVADREFSAMEAKGRRMGLQIRESMGLAKTAIVGFVAANGVAAIKGVIDQSLEYAAAMKRQAQLSNTSVERFQEVAHAAKSVGIESEKLSDIYKDVNDRVGEFIQTGGGEMKDFFEKIAPKVNVTAQAFKGLSGPDALQLYYTSLEKAGLNQQEMTFYMESMADEASGLIPLLRKNGEQMKSLSDDAKRLGLVMSEEMIKKSGEAQKKLNALENVLSAKLAVAVASNSDKIIGMADRLETLAVRAEKAWIWLNKLSDSRLGQAVGWLNDKASYLSTTGLMVRGLDELSAPAPAASGGSRPAAARPAGMRPLSGSSPDMWKNMTFPTQYQNRFAGGGFPGAMSPIEGFDPGGLVDALAQVTAGLEKIETGGEDAAAAIHQCGIELKGLKGMLPEDTEAEMALIIDRARELKVEAKDMAGELQQAFRDVRENGIDALSDGITEAIMGSESLGDVFKSVASQIVADLLRIAVRRSIVEPLADAMFGGQGGGGLLKSAGMALGGFFAEGGRPPMGKVSVVGERGPELFVPDRPGTIVPNNAIAAMRAIQVPNVALRAPSQQTIVRQTIMVDARGSVMNDEFAAGILARSKSYAADARDQAIKASVGAVPARMARFDRDGF